MREIFKFIFNLLQDAVRPPVPDQTSQELCQACETENIPITYCQVEDNIHHKGKCELPTVEIENDYPRNNSGYTNWKKSTMCEKHHDRCCCTHTNNFSGERCSKDRLSINCGINKDGKNILRFLTHCEDHSWMKCANVKCKERPMEDFYYCDKHKCLTVGCPFQRIHGEKGHCLDHNYPYSKIHMRYYSRVITKPLS